MMKAYQIRLYEYNDHGTTVLERQAIALLTPAQRDELEAWLCEKFPGSQHECHATIVPYDLHNFDTVKEALTMDAHDLVAGAFWPKTATGRIPRERA